MVRGVMVAVGVVAAVVVLGAMWLDEGEIVTLSTTDTDSIVHHTQLWAVELDEVHYLRASSSRVEWFARLRDRPLVELDFGGLSAHFRAVPLDDAALRTRVNAEMALKYGFADRLWGLLGDRSSSIPIRLEPAEDLASGHGDAS